MTHSTATSTPTNLEFLFEHIASQTLERRDRLASAVSSDAPSFANAELLDEKLLELWPSLPPEARALLLLLANLEARASNENYDRY